MEILSALGYTYVCRGLPALALGDHIAHDRDIRVWEYWPVRHFVFTSHIHPLTTTQPGEAKEIYSLIQAAELHPILPGLRFPKQVPLILAPQRCLPDGACPVEELPRHDVQIFWGENVDRLESFCVFTP